VGAWIVDQLRLGDAGREIRRKLGPIWTAYPPHIHAGVEELHRLDGELWIDDRKLFPGDYNRGEPGTGDSRVWSETGCTCVLVTSFRDILQGRGHRDRPVS
jgi:anti-sigma factor ChrR (cupin superfamily)